MINRIFLISIIMLGITSCKTVQDGKYLGGMVEVSGFTKPEKNDSQGEHKTDLQNASSRQAVKECSAIDASYHPLDPRWCANLFLAGADFSEEISYQEIVNAPVDLAYIRAKRFLEFKDPDDALDPQYNEHYDWDGIAGTYYGVKGSFGGPSKQLLYYSDYDLRIEKITDLTSKVKIKYRIYGREDIEPRDFGETLFNIIKSDE